MRPSRPAPSRACASPSGWPRPGVVAEIRAAGLRGRGGAGFLTADKWQLAAATPADRRYVVANGYGADPATRTDATLLERDPYAVIEGLAIAAWAIGADTAIIAVRATETEAIRRLEAALGAAEDAGFIGGDVLDTGRELNVEVRPVQGAYMLGEETVLLKALEGKRGQPEQRPPHPAERGLFGRPTVVQNVQTLALAAWIMHEGAAKFRTIGTPDAPGTILVHVRGAGGAGVAEVPLGTPMRTILGLVAATTRTGSAPKALLVGGPSGGILPADLLDTPYTFDDLRAAGAHIGSGSIVATAAERRRPRARRAAHPVLLRRGLRQDDPLPDRDAPPRGDRRPDQCRDTAPDRCRPDHRPVRRHRCERPVRPRAPGDTSDDQRDAILPTRAGREAPARRGASRPMTELIARPAPPPEMSLSERLLTTQAPQRPQSDPVIRVEVDGRVVEGRAGQTILEVCRDNGIEIPTLCYEPKLPGFGACRMCVVEVEGEEHPPISCSRAAEAGMKVATQTEAVRRLRATNLELIFSDHNAYCLPPCQNKCPSHIDIPGFLKQNAEGDWRESSRIFKRTIPFPSVLGRVCPAPCEEHCRRDEVDEAIAIRDSHRYAGDQVLKAMLNEGIDPPVPVRGPAQDRPPGCRDRLRPGRHVGRVLPADRRPRRDRLRARSRRRAGCSATGSPSTACRRSRSSRPSTRA